MSLYQVTEVQAKRIERGLMMARQEELVAILMKHITSRLLDSDDYAAVTMQTTLDTQLIANKYNSERQEQIAKELGFG